MVGAQLLWERAHRGLWRGVGRSLSDQGSKEQVLGTEDSGERERGAEGWWQREGEGERSSRLLAPGCQESAAGEGVGAGMGLPSVSAKRRRPIHRALGWGGRLRESESPWQTE